MSEAPIVLMDQPKKRHVGKAHKERKAKYTIEYLTNGFNKTQAVLATSSAITHENARKNATRVHNNLFDPSLVPNDQKRTIEEILDSKYLVDCLHRVFTQTDSDQSKLLALKMLSDWQDKLKAREAGQGINSTESAILAKYEAEMTSGMPKTEIVAPRPNYDDSSPIVVNNNQSIEGNGHATNPS